MTVDVHLINEPKFNKETAIVNSPEILYHPTMEMRLCVELLQSCSPIFLLVYNNVCPQQAMFMTTLKLKIFGERTSAPVIDLNPTENI